MVGLSARAHAQDGNPDAAPVQLGSVALAPSFRLFNVGWDSNPLYRSDSEDPQSDITATFAPALEAWVRRNRLRLATRAELDFNYFHELSAIRSVDQDYRGRLELAFGRVTPYVGGSWVNARHRPNYEIDAPIRRIDSAWLTGIDVALSPKTTLGAAAGRSGIEYAEHGPLEDTDLGSALDTNTRTRGVYVKYAVTPLTTLGADVVRDEIRISSPDRDSRGYRVSASAEFRPRAIVSGRVQVGVRTREYDVADVPSFTGVVSQIALDYTLLSRTRFSVQFQHDLVPSYRTDFVEYLQTGLSASVAHRLTAAWDLTATLGRYNLDYEVGAPASSRAGAPNEQVVGYGFDIGYRFGRARVAGGMTRQERVTASTAARLYDRTQIALSMTYAF